MIILIYSLIFLYGAWTGSFCGLIADRLPRGQEIVKKRSHCPNCHSTLGPIDLWPIAGWLIRRGRCAQCAFPIPMRYVIIELLYGLAFLLIVKYLGITPAALLAAIAFSLWGIVIMIAVYSKKIASYLLMTAVILSVLSAWMRF